MKNTLRKRNIKTHKKHKANNRRTRRRSGGFINSSHITNAYNTATQTYQSLNDAYSGLQQKYQESMQQYHDIMQQYQDMKEKYDNIKEKLTEISNDPAVQKHLDTLSTLHSQLTSTMTPEEKMTGGFFNTSSFNNAYQSANTSLTNKKQQFNTVYKHPEVQKNFKDLSTHSYNTAKHGSLLGVNVATGAPFSAAYRGYNTYSSAKKGVKSAKKLYSSANDAYKSSVPQVSI
jgi:DNA repair exonuclease SbcCD ATPase subunit